MTIRTTGRLASTGKEEARIFLTVSASIQKKKGGREETGLGLNCALPMSAKPAWCARRVDRSIYGVVTGRGLKTCGVGTSAYIWPSVGHVISHSVPTSIHGIPEESNRITRLKCTGAGTREGENGREGGVQRSWDFPPSRSVPMPHPRSTNNLTGGSKMRRPTLAESDIRVWISRHKVVNVIAPGKEGMPYVVNRQLRPERD